MFGRRTELETSVCTTRKVQLFATFILAVCESFMYEVKDSISEQNARENAHIICDYLTAKKLGIITVAYLKVCDDIHRLLKSKRTETRENTRYPKHSLCKKNRLDRCVLWKPRIICWEQKIQKGMLLNSFYRKKVSTMVCYEMYTEVFVLHYR